MVDFAADDLTLPLPQGRTLNMTFAWRQPDDSYANFHDWDIVSQVRSKQAVDADLLLDLTPFFTVVNETGTDGKILVLKVPGSVTATMEATGWSNAWWSIIAVLKVDHTIDAGIADGPVDFDPTPTAAAEAEA
jgi:hypothetical protein